jgi:multidrug resistance efflux pump
MMNPKLLGDLEMAEQPDGIVIQDSSRNKFYRFSGASAQVLKMLDGCLPPDEISATLARHSNVKISPETVQAFLERLRTAGLLEGSERPAEAPRRHRDDILNVRLKAIDPRRVFDWLLPRTAFLFSSRFICVSLVLMLAALYVFITRSGEIHGSLAGFLTPSRLLETLLVALLVGAIHEFAHGLASEHFGARVHEMGFLLMFFQPCLYCDVSGSWILPKRQRLLVMLAGNWSTFLIWALATLAWRILAAEAVLSDLCVSAMLVCGFSMFANFNPLIRLDGYYMLSDILNVPNLRPRAFRYLCSRIEGRAVDVASRERLTYTVYGAGAMIFSLSLIGSVLWFAGGYLLSHLHLAGMGILTALVAVPAVAQKKTDALVVVASATRALWKRFRGFVRLLSVAAALIALGLTPWELKVSGPFSILAERELTVAPQVDGQITAIHVEDGSRVRRGQPIAVLANPDVVRNAAKTRAELDAGRARLAVLRSGSRPEDVERLRVEVSRKRLELAQARDPETERNRLQTVIARHATEVAHAQQNLSRATQLFDAGLTPKMELERVEHSLAVEQKLLEEARGALSVSLEAKFREAELRGKELLEAQSRLDLAIVGPRREEVEAAEADVRRLGAESGFLEDELRRATVLSPADGVVATPYLQNRLGQFIRRGETLCKIVTSAAETTIEMSIPEREAGDLALGFPVAVKLNSYLSRPTLAGRLAFIAPEISTTSGSNFVRVECRIQDHAGLLKPGMAGVAKIYCGRRNVFQLATRRAMSWVRTEFWTWLP